MFFSWENLIFKNWQQYQKFPLQVCIAPRNVGKTYDTFNFVIKDGGFKENAKVVYFRNSQNEMRKAIADLNSRFKNQYIFSNGLIYNLKPKKMKDTITDEKIVVYIKNRVIGYFASLNDYQNSKGLEAKDVKYFIYDEFNEDSIIGKNLYFKFCNVVKTFERFNKIKYFFILGNKDGVDNDFYLNWDIVPLQDWSKDNITQIKEFGVCYDLSEKHFEDLDNASTLANKLMMLDGRTRQYALGGYGAKITRFVMKYSDLIKTFKLMFKLAIDDDNFYFGTTEFGYTILSPWNYINYDVNVKTYALNLYSGLAKGSVILKEDIHQDLIEFIFKNEKLNNLFYDSYDTRQLIRDIIFVYTRILRK